MTQVGRPPGAGSKRTAAACAAQAYGGGCLSAAQPSSKRTESAKQLTLCELWPVPRTRPRLCLGAADAIDDEVPGSVRADVEPLVLEGEPFNPFPAGGAQLTTVVSVRPAPGVSARLQSN